MKTIGVRLPQRIFTLRSYFFYITLITITVYVGWSFHRVANERAEALREQKLRAINEQRIVSANLDDFCRNMMKLPGVKKVTVIKGQLDRVNPVNSEFIFAVTPESILDESLAIKMKLLCSNRFAGVRLEKIAIVDANTIANRVSAPQ